MSFAPASLPWLARHELRLAWRDWIAMATGGQHRRSIFLLLAVLALAAGLHWLTDALLRPWATAGLYPDRPTLLLVTGSGVLFFTAMLSQALESVTRAYYARSDLELILSSPASARRLFAVRTTATALLTLALACLLASPVINVLAWHDGPHWLAAYAVLAALSAVSTAVAVLIAIGLFNLVGPQRTRLLAQIVAGIVGAGFVIGVQAIAILAYGDYSRFAILQSDELLTAAPSAGHLLWLPARAAMGDLTALSLMLPLAFAILAIVIVITSRSFARHAVAAGGISRAPAARQRSRSFRSGDPRQALRRKEWRLLRRDPWLLSQTLTQLLYLVPPALLLWVNFGSAAGVGIIVVPVLVMASGQLAGGLAWLAISGEDAHDLVATAPVPPRLVLRAKIEAVVAVIAVVLAPLLVLLSLASPLSALVVALGAALAAGSATAIQLWFRMPMRRAMFRRRQVASRLATLSEAFVSIMWAGTAALLAAGSWMAIMAVVPAILAFAMLGFAWLLSPKGRPT
ncbi:MAG TPA: permease [Devosiaceae bacterium]|jgi:ABC-2 type transport system permease protein|nr:permease [Devosiaceae bacterium]